MHQATASTLDEGDRFGKAVAATRIVMSCLGFFAPRLTQRLSLLGTSADAQTRIWTRFWATRAFALGAGYLTAPPEARRHLLQMGLVVDAADTAFLTLMATRARSPRRALGWLAALTGAAAAADIAELSRGSSATP